MKTLKKQNIFKKFFNANLQMLLVIHQKQLIIYSSIKYLFFFLGQFQSSFFYLYPCYMASSNIYNNFYIVYMIRPDLIIIDDLMFNFPDELGFIIPLTLVIGFEIIILQSQVLYQLIKGKDSNNLHYQIEMSGSVQRIAINLKSLYSQLFLVYIYIPAQTLCIKSFSISNANMDFDLSFLSVLTIILLLITQIIKASISNTTLDLIIRSYERLFFSKADFLRELIILLQIIMFAAFQDIKIAAIIQGILAIATSITYLLNCFSDNTMVLDIYIKITILIQTSLVAVIIFSLLDIWEIGLLLAPLAIWFGINEATNYKRSLFETICDEKDLQKIILFIASVMNQQQNKQNKLSQLSHSIVLSRHRSKCHDLVCYCQGETAHTDNPNNLLLLSDQIRNKFIISKIRLWNKIISQNRNRNSESLWIHYISCLSYFGFVTQAFQECNRLLSLSSLNQHRGFLSHNSSEPPSQQKSFPSQSSESQNKINKAKLQEIKAKSIEKQSKIKIGIKNTILSTLAQTKLKIMSKEVRLALQNNFLNQQKKSQEEIAEAITLFLISEQQNQKVKHKVIKCFQQKLQFYNWLQSKKGVKALKLFQNAKILSNSFYKLERQLLKQYSQFPSQKTQSINCFLQSELLNNYLTAYKLSNFSTISDEKLMNMKKNLKVNLFGKTVLNMIMHVSDNLQTMEITQFSNGIHQFLSLSYDEFIRQNKIIDVFLPLAIRNEHYMLVQKFMNDGKSKYFRNIDLSFLQLPNGFVKPFNLVIDIILSHTEHLSFAVFFEEISLTNGYIIVDVNCFCGGITSIILEKSGWKQSEIKQYQHQINIGYQVSINQIIPDFPELKEKQETKFYNVTVNLLNKRALMNIQSKSIASLHETWSHSLNVASYKGTIILWARELYGYYYFIIEIEDLRLNQTMTNYSTQQVQDTKGTTLHIKDSPDVIEVIDLEVSLTEAGINIPQSLNIFQQSISDIDNENDISLQAHIKQINPQGSYLPYNADNSKVQSLIQLKNQYQYQNYDDQQNEKNMMMQHVADITPNQSIRKLMDTSKSFGQQRFFNKDIQELDQSNSKVSEEQNQIKGVNQLYEVDLNKIDREMRENIKLQLQIEEDFKNQTSQPVDDAASQVSSLIGLKKSIFYKKYELMNRLIEAKVMPTSFKLCNALLSCCLITMVIYCIITIDNLTVDFNRFIQEVDMLLFHQSFMAPFDVFLSLRFSTAYYKSQVTKKIMTDNDNIILADWLANHLGEGYDDMKTNFLDQFSNPYLLEFFTNSNFDVYFMKENASSFNQKTLSFRESLNVLLQYQYQFKVAYLNKVSVSSQPFVSYSYQNYLNLHDKFDNMTNEILSYTIERKNAVSEKWRFTWIPILIINFILIILSYYSYRVYLANYENFLNLFKYADETWLYRDTERYKILISILTKDSDVMFKYQFDLEQKEQFMMAEKYKKETKVVHEAKKKRVYDDFEKLPSIYGLLGLAFLFSIYFIFSLLITLQVDDYLYRYSNTAVVYKFMGDLCFQCPGLFSQRQFLYSWKSYYIPNADKPRMIARLFDGVDNLKQFGGIVDQFNEADYLTTSYFLGQLDQLTKHPVCEFFSETLQQDYVPYCNISFDGALMEGLTQAFTYAANQYKVTYALNNFTSIAQYFRYEAEGMYIMVKGVIELVSSLKEALLSATHTHMNQIIGFAVFLMVFYLIILSLQYFFLYAFYQEEYDLVRRFMLLLPSSTLLLDDNFERKIRIFYVQFQI